MAPRTQKEKSQSGSAEEHRKLGFGHAALDVRVRQRLRIEQLDTPDLSTRGSFQLKTDVEVTTVLRVQRGAGLRDITEAEGTEERQGQC